LLALLIKIALRFVIVIHTTVLRLIFFPVQYKERTLLLTRTDTNLTMILASSQASRGHIRKGHIRGFTLIELLVVIAIIGILSAVVLASLNTARAKGTDASIKSDLNTVQTQAALDYDAYPNAYATTAGTLGSAEATFVTAWTAGTGAPGTTGVSPFLTGANGDLTAGTALAQAATVTSGGIAGAYTATTFVVEAKLTATSGTYWCIDSTGKAEQTSTVISGTGCP
jgi:prepilin-type N-terminal cleavage/methylation domain-containing protein